jgi:hypothetical protein
MGTSASSKGPGGGVPMVPPWVPDLGPPKLPQKGKAAAPPDGDGHKGQPTAAPNQPAPNQPAKTQPSPIAPAARFGGARRNLGNFARGGDRRDMWRGLRDYVRKG